MGPLLVLVDAVDKNRDVGKPIGTVLEATFPDDQDAPAQPGQLLPIAFISSHVGVEFGLPETCSCLRCGGVEAARVAVPETAMNEDG